MKTGILAARLRFYTDGFRTLMIPVLAQSEGSCLVWFLFLRRARRHPCLSQPCVSKSMQFRVCNITDVVHLMQQGGTHHGGVSTLNDHNRNRTWTGVWIKRFSVYADTGQSQREREKKREKRDISRTRRQHQYIYPRVYKQRNTGGIRMPRRGRDRRCDVVTC